MPRSLWSVAGEALVTVAMLIGPPLLASRLGWPLSKDVSWAWLWQYLRGGNLPAEAVLAAFVALLWVVWIAYLVIVALDIIALLRGLAPRVGLVRLVWVLITGGATVAGTHSAAVAAHTDMVVEVDAEVKPEPEEQRKPSPEHHDLEDEVFDRIRTLAGFGFDSADLTPSMRDSLEPTLGMISDFGLAEAPVVITGHADPVGDPDYNRDLSERRAQAVADYLTEHLEDDVVFEVEGVGSAQPPTDPGASYAEQRRVEIVYTLQPPSTEEANTKDRAETEEEEGEPNLEQVQLDVTTTSDQSGPSPLLVGAVAGVAGAGVGYAAGRRRAHPRSGRPKAKVHGQGDEVDQPEESLVEADHGTDSGAMEQLVRLDPCGIENGVIDGDGCVLVGETTRIDATRGIAFVGAYAVDALAAVVTDHLPGPVIATRAVAEALQDGPTFHDGLVIVPDLLQARLAVEARLLSAARGRMEDDLEIVDGNAQDEIVPVLVVCEADQLEADPGLVPLTLPEAVVCVLGEREPMPAVHCVNLERPHLVWEQDRIDLPEPLRHRGPDTHSGDETHEGEEEEKEEPSPEEAKTPKALPPLANHDSPAAPSAPRAETTTVRVRMFSSDAEPDLTFGGRQVQGLRSVARPLVAYLALHPQGVEAEQIDAECFGEVEPAKAYAQRRNAIHSLRHTLRKITDTPDAPVIIKDKSGLYRMDQKMFDVDLWDFLRRAKILRKNPESISDDQLRCIVGIHQEKLLGECEAEWIEDVRRYCAKEAVSACVRLADNNHDVAERIHDLETAIAFDEYNEPLYQSVIAMHYKAGFPERAHLVYRELKGRLGKIGEKPSKKTRSMIQEYAPPGS